MGICKIKVQTKSQKFKQELLQCHANSCNDVKTIEWNFKKIYQSMSSPSQIKDQRLGNPR